MSRLIVVRHGMPDEGHATQPADPPLNATGHRQAQELAERLAAEGVDRIVASPQLRAQNTAAPLAERLGLAIETLEGLAEIDRHSDRYRSPETLKREDPERWDEFRRSPARYYGLDPEAYRLGVLGAFAHIFAGPADARIAVFTHGTPVKTLLAHVLSLTTTTKLSVGHCSVSRFAGNSLDSLMLVSVNETLIATSGT